MGAPLEFFPKPLRSTVLPSGKVHPHAGAFGNGVQVPFCPGTNELSNNNRIPVVNFIISSSISTLHTPELKIKINQSIKKGGVK